MQLISSISGFLYSHGWSSSSGHGAFYWWVPLLIVLTVIAVAAVVYLIARGLKGGEVKTGGVDPDSPLGVVQLRYAAGDITLEEYKEIEDMLSEE